MSDTEPTETEDVEHVAFAPPVDPMNRLLASGALALAALGLAEIIGTIVVGLAVKVQKMSFISRQGYAFLTQLEKSPVGLMLVVAALLAGAAMIRADRDGTDNNFARYASWIAIVAAVILGLGTVLAVMARFRVAELVTTQPVDAITRRQLVVYVIRNFGTAVVALLIAVGAAFQRVRPPSSV